MYKTFTNISEGKNSMSHSIEQLSINTIRTLSIDAIEKANSGHPGMPMGAAPMAYTLWTQFMKHNPNNQRGLTVIVSYYLQVMVQCYYTAYFTYLVMM
ncbi:hypothetical protein BT10792_30040 [Bacillus thuringiensis]|nr:hypothetical protein BT10792_30040 [Bacillus thuringiensis]